MPSSVADRLAVSPRNSIAKASLSPDHRSESARNRVADPNRHRGTGRLLRRAFELLGVTQQDVSYRLGFADSNRSSVNRWLSGSEPADLDRLIEEIDGFREAYAEAILEGSNAPGVRVERVIRIPVRRTAVSA